MRRIDLTKAQAARSSTIRDLNRQFVLNYIRDREPISRAEIARSTELQRSTVSTIVEELKDDDVDVNGEDWQAEEVEVTEGGA